MRRIADQMGRRLLVPLCLAASSGCAWKHGPWSAFRGKTIRAEARQSNQVEHMSLEAQHALDNVDPQTAKPLLEQLVAATPKSAEAHHRLGRALEQMGRRQDAETEYRRSLEIDPEYVDALTSLGQTQALDGKPSEALQLLESAIEISPRLSQAHLERGKALEALGRTSEAVSAYFRALEEEPNLPEAQLRVAAIQLKQGRADQALARLNSAAERQPDDPEIRYQRGLAYLQTQRPEQALEDLRVAAADPRFAQKPETLYHLALALRANRQTREAIATNRKALEIAPNFAQAQQLDRELR